MISEDLCDLIGLLPNINEPYFINHFCLLTILIVIWLTIINHSYDLIDLMNFV